MITNALWKARCGAGNSTNDDGPGSMNPGAVKINAYGRGSTRMDVRCSRGSRKSEVLGKQQRLTPIEDLLLAAAKRSSYRVLAVAVGVASPSDLFGATTREFGHKWLLLRPCILIAPQVPFAGYRADFLVEMIDAKAPCPIRLFIECDGHDFHEKTKQQAARDRRRDRVFQLYAPVLRFTGSELFADASQCWEEVVYTLSELCQDRLRDYRGARLDAMFDCMCEDDGVSDLAHRVALVASAFERCWKLDHGDLLSLGVTEDAFPEIVSALAPYLRVSVDTAGKFVFRPLRQWVRT